MGTAALRARNEKIEPSWVRLVKGQVEAMRFGVVQIVVHDSHVVQIERTEKLRLDKSESQAHFPGASKVGDFQHRFVPPAEEASQGCARRRFPCRPGDWRQHTTIRI